MYIYSSLFYFGDNSVQNIALNLVRDIIVDVGLSLQYNALIYIAYFWEELEKTIWQQASKRDYSREKIQIVM